MIPGDVEFFCVCAILSSNGLGTQYVNETNKISDRERESERERGRDMKWIKTTNRFIQLFFLCLGSTTTPVKIYDFAMNKTTEQTANASKESIFKCLLSI